jgi:hypothetical protein
MWIRQDGDGPAYGMECIPANDTVEKVRKGLDDRTIATIGFNISDPPCMWVVKKL